MAPPSARGLRWPAARAALLLAGLWAGTVGAAVAGAPAAGRPDTAATPRRYSIKDSPGYVPLVDPESLSVTRGRRLNAPAVRQPFRGGTRSLDALGRAVCRAIHHRDADSLRKLCIDEDEFRGILWREFPQSRPVTGLTWEDAWRVLDIRLMGGCNGAIQDLGGRYYEFLRVERADTTALYRNFKLHNGLILVVRNDQGETERWGWLRSVAERRGVFKIYSTTD